jgi:hypothetical protein
MRMSGCNCGYSITTRADDGAHRRRLVIAVHRCLRMQPPAGRVLPVDYTLARATMPPAKYAHGSRWQRCGGCIHPGRVLMPTQARPRRHRSEMLLCGCLL